MGGPVGLNNYRQQDYYVPGPSSDPQLGGVEPSGYHWRPTALKTLNVSIHVWRDSNGNFNLTDTEQNRLMIAAMVNHASQHYFEAPDLPSDPAVADWQNYYLNDTRIRLKANAIHFYNDSYFWESGGGPCSGAAFLESASAAALAQHPELANTVLIHLIGNWGCVQSIDPVTGQPNYANGAASLPYWSLSDWGKPSQLVIRGTQNTTWGLSDATHHAHILAHELGHVLGLKHTYAFGGESTTPVQDDFLDDIFSCYQQTNASNPWCSSAVATCPQGPGAWQLCHQNAPSSCSPWSNPFDDCTNNMMALFWGRFISNQQMGRMHRSLMLTNVSKCADGYNTAPFTPYPIGETWIWPMKFYQDIHIKNGYTLTVKCELQMVANARIVVEAGGRLIIDGGKITNAMYDAPNGYFNQPWRGIEVWGWSGAEQEQNTNGMFINHGLVEIINGGVVENAEIGVFLGKPGDPTQAGGVLRMAGTASNPPGVIRNCRTGVKFDPYTSLSSNGLAALNNRSTFAHARFEWTDDFDNIHRQNNPIALADLNGVRVSFRACAFEHSGQYPQYSSQLGYGIKAHNSTVWVMDACPNVTGSCPLAQRVPCTFTGLDHGVHATASVGLPRLSVHRAQFTSNVCGVYGEGLRNPMVRHCTFNVGERAVTLDAEDEEYWLDRHRGIFFTHCNGLRVMNNTLTEASEPAAPTEGIVIGYTTTGSESIRSNTVSGMDRGYVGEGVSANQAAQAAIGLQFLCNTNNANGDNIWSRIANGAPQNQWEINTIRLNQGAHNMPALNYLDNHPQPPDGSTDPADLRVSTQSLITYWHVAAARYAPTSIAGMAAPTLSGPEVLYGCPILVSGASDQLALQGEVEQARQAYAGLRFLYANLIDGGSTDVVLDEIAAAWPQDYWDLRAYLLSKSPYLSVEVLKEAMEKEGFPDAMRAEICIANPEATQKEGFLKWLENECTQPLPEALLEAIEASWAVKTYRATLEMQMGQEHLRMSEAAYALAELLAADDEQSGTDQAEELAALQLLRTAEARYDEALLLAGRHQYAQARAPITALPGEHELKGKQVDERTRMLAYIDFLEAVHANGRTPAQLTAAEVAQLRAFINVEHDRPTQWASHLLCYHHGICRSPYTGDAGQEPKARRKPPVTIKPQPELVLTLKPNPANAWVAIDYDLKSAGAGRLEVLDAMGRRVHERALGSSQAQLVLDTRPWGEGLYTVRLTDSSGRMRSERLIAR